MKEIKTTSRLSWSKHNLTGLLLRLQQRLRDYVAHLSRRRPTITADGTRRRVSPAVTGDGDNGREFPRSAAVGGFGSADQGRLRRRRGRRPSRLSRVDQSKRIEASGAVAALPLRGGGTFASTRLISEIFGLPPQYSPKFGRLRCLPHSHCSNLIHYQTLQIS